MDLSCYATCPDDLTPFLAEEIRKIGGREIKSDYRVVYFTATPAVYYKAHICLRTVSRLCLVLKNIPAQNPRIVFDKARRVAYHQWFDAGEPLGIQVHTANDGGKLNRDLIGSKLREAVKDVFQHHQKKEANPSARNSLLALNGFYQHNRLMISLDTSGDSLHKRGFRAPGHPAPLKESLAAALLDFCEYDGTVPFYDPMCGSGTIVLEAALMAMNRAPRLGREAGMYGLSRLKSFDPQIWKKVRSELKGRERSVAAPIEGADISQAHLKIARESVAKSGLAKIVKLHHRDFFSHGAPAETGLLLMNIPYGLRLDEKPLEKAYMRRLGDVFKQHYKGWRCAILAPQTAPLKEVGLKPLKQQTFRNGTVPVKCLVYDIY